MTQNELSVKAVTWVPEVIGVPLWYDESEVFETLDLVELSDKTNEETLIVGKMIEKMIEYVLSD
jgi:hypothetical protein